MALVSDKMVIALIEGLHGPGWPWHWSPERQEKRINEYRLALAFVERARELEVSASDAAVEAASKVFEEAGVYPGRSLVAKALAAAGSMMGQIDEKAFEAAYDESFEIVGSLLSGPGVRRILERYEAARAQPVQRSFEEAFAATGYLYGADALEQVRLGWNLASAPRPAPKPRKCPTCTSPDPRKHPAVQHEGEVQICKDDWHEPKLRDDGQPVAPNGRLPSVDELCERIWKLHQRTGVMPWADAPSDAREVVRTMASAVQQWIAVFPHEELAERRVQVKRLEAEVAAHVAQAEAGASMLQSARATQSTLVRLRAVCESLRLCELPPLPMDPHTAALLRFYDRVRAALSQARREVPPVGSGPVCGRCGEGVRDHRPGGALAGVCVGAFAVETAISPTADTLPPAAGQRFDLQNLGLALYELLAGLRDAGPSSALARHAMNYLLGTAKPGVDRPAPAGGAL